MSAGRVMTTQTHIEFSSSDHGVDLCSVLYTIMPMGVEFCFHSLLVFMSQCPGFVDVIVTPGLQAITCTFTYCRITQVSEKRNQSIHTDSRHVS